MKCLVLGGGGFIGSHLTESLLKTGYDVAVFDVPEARYLEHVRSQGAKIITGNFLNPNDLNLAVQHCDIVFHLASMTVPQISNDNPLLDVEANVMGTLRLLDTARNAQVKKIIFSSSGGTVYGIPQEIPIREDHPTEPTSSYGITKLTIEKYLHLYWMLHGLDYGILRIANAYGERQPITTTQGVISSFLSKAIRHEEFVVCGDGSVLRDYIYVGDIVSAFLKIAVYDGQPKVFNVGAGQGHSLLDIISIIEKTIQRPLQIKYEKARLFDVPVNVLDTTNASQYLKWKPEVGLLEGIDRAYKWMLKEYEK